MAIGRALSRFGCVEKPGELNMLRVRSWCMPENGSIDSLDYSILKVVRDAGTPLWKARIHEMIEGRFEELPLLRRVSFQTVGRHVDQLRNSKLLDAVVIEPEALDRNLVIGFTVTEKGIDALDNKRCDHISDIVRKHVFEESRQEAIRKDLILTVFEDEFDLNTDTIADLSGQFDEEELVSLLAVYYTEAKTADVLSEEERDLIRRIAREQESEEAMATLAD